MFISIRERELTQRRGGPVAARRLLAALAIACNFACESEAQSSAPPSTADGDTGGTDVSTASDEPTLPEAMGTDVGHDMGTELASEGATEAGTAGETELSSDDATEAGTAGETELSSDDATEAGTAGGTELSTDVATEEGAEQSRAGGPCPESAPEEGSSCETAGAFCSYDLASAPQCRQAFSCSIVNRVWAPTVLPGVSPCFSPPPEECAEPPTVGQTCEMGTQACRYNGATCGCSAPPICTPDGTCADPDAPPRATWSCREEQPNCPWAPQNAGTVCDDVTLRCLYGEPCGGMYVVCVDGYVEWESALCP